MAPNFPPGPKGLPFFGSTFEIRRDPLAFFIRLEREYGPIAGVRLPHFDMVFASRAASVRHVLIENAGNFTNREAYFQLVPLLGDGLLTIDGAYHKQQRRLVMPAFHRQRVENYAEIMISDALDMLHRWQPGQQVDLASELQWLTLRIVAKALFNVDLGAENSELSRAFIATADYLNKANFIDFGNLDLPFTAYGKFKRGKAVLDATVYRIIQGHRLAAHDSGDMLSMLFKAKDEDGSSLTDQQIHDETLTFLAAGHATTANALTWTFYLLSQHPEACQKLLDEVWGVVGVDRPPLAADLERMPYLEWVVKESLRLYPPAWTVLRRASSEFELEGYHLPAGTFVALSQYVTHRLPQYWSEPERFWPERFAPEHAEPREAFAYFPFGAGPRTCIGMPFAMLEARLLLAAILQRFTPHLAPGARVVAQPLVTLRPLYGLPVVLERSIPISSRRSEVNRPAANDRD